MSARCSTGSCPFRALARAWRSPCFPPHTVGQLYSLVMAEDDKGMAKVPGVGKKTAQRLILELKSTFAKDKALCRST